MDILSKTSLVVMVDDPLLSRNLGEFFNQIQGGLYQGSASAGLHVPKGSVLVSSNDQEVTRIERRVQRFDYVRDDGFEVNNFMERQIMDLANNNKGLLVAWCMCFQPVWQEQEVETIPILQNILQKAFPREQLRWVKGQAFSLCAYAMLHATASKTCHLANLIEDLRVERQTFQPPILARFQMQVFSRLLSEDDTKQAHVWINPFCTVNLLSGVKTAAFAFSKESVNLLGPEVSNQELEDELKWQVHPKSITQPCCFALNRETPLSSLRKKKAGESDTISRRAFKIPTHLFNPLTISWIQYAVGIRQDCPVKHLEEDDLLDHDMETNILVDDIEHVEKSIYNRIKEFMEEQRGNQANQQAINLQGVAEAVQNMSPLTYQNWTPNRKRAFEMGVTAANNYQNKQRSTKDTASSPFRDAAKSAEAIQKISSTSSQNSNEQTNARKELFPEGTVGIILGQKKSKVQKRVNLNVCPCGKKYAGRKTKKQNWIQCDGCEQWLHMECAELNQLPEKEWFCKNCPQKK